MKRPFIIGAAAVTLGVLAGTSTALAASASIPDSSGVIHACYDTGGNVKVIDTAVTSSCPKGYTPLNWNQTGPAGPAGRPGAPGPAGPSTAGFGGLDVVTVTNATQTSPDVFVGCPATHPFVLGGGGNTDGAGSLFVSEPFREGTVQGWLVDSTSAPVGAAEIIAKAICAK